MSPLGALSALLPARLRRKESFSLKRWIGFWRDRFAAFARPVRKRAPEPFMGHFVREVSGRGATRDLWPADCAAFKDPQVALFEAATAVARTVAGNAILHSTILDRNEPQLAIGQPNFRCCSVPSDGRPVRRETPKPRGRVPFAAAFTMFGARKGSERIVRAERS